MNVTIGKKIKVLRVLREMTQTQLARMTDMAQYDITSFENGKAHPAVDSQRAIEAALGCRLDADITITAAGDLVCVAPVKEAV